MALSAACTPVIDVGGSSKTAVFRRFLRPGSEVPMAFSCRSCPCSRKTAIQSYRDKKTCPCSASGAVSALPGQRFGARLVFVLPSPSARPLVFAS